MPFMLRHGNVENNDVRPQFPGRGKESVSIVHRADHFKTGLKDALQTIEQHRMIVAEQNSDFAHRFETPKFEF